MIVNALTVHVWMFAIQHRVGAGELRQVHNLLSFNLSSAARKASFTWLYKLPSTGQPGDYNQRMRTCLEVPSMEEKDKRKSYAIRHYKGNAPTGLNVARGPLMEPYCDLHLI